MTIVTVVGARPQFVKAAVVSRAIRELGGVREILVHTGQHYDDNMSAVFFADLEIPAPEYNLNIGSGSHGAQTGRMLEAIEGVLLETKPDWMLVYGDTNSTLAGALAAAKLHIPVAHVEAGPRTYNRLMPEEINRVVTDHLSDLLFPPTAAAAANLRCEGIPDERVRPCGDVMYDAALYYATKSQSHSDILARLNLRAEAYVLATVHRAGNTDSPERLGAILGGLAIVAAELPVVLPLHPRTRKLVAGRPEFDAALAKLTVTEPVGYLDMVQLEQHARLIATDSGGVQKEAYFHRVPCVTLDDQSGWVELLETGWNVLVVPTDAAAVARAIMARMDTQGSEVFPYGDGHAAERIAEWLCR